MSEAASREEKRNRHVAALLRERKSLEAAIALNEALGEDNRGLGTLEEIDADLRAHGYELKGAR